jgi:hypothetical protein
MQTQPAIYFFTQGWATVYTIALLFVVLQYRLRTGSTRHAKATLNRYRRRHDAWKARRLCRTAPGRLAVLPSRAAQPAGLPGITPSA